METIIEQIMHWPMPAPMFVLFGVFFLIGMVIKGVVNIAISASHERTKREVAAYIAEGSIEPEKAIALLNAGRRPGGGQPV